MEIKIRNNQNICRTSSNFKTARKNGYFSDNSLKNDVFVKRNVGFTGLNPEKILEPFEKFGTAEYKKLVPKQIEILRASLSEELIEDRNAAIALSNIVKTNLDQAYQNGYVLISIGRSPTVIGKALEYQGADLKYIPISGLGREGEYGNFVDKISDLPAGEIYRYRKYLRSIGISTGTIKNTKKTYIFTDYTLSGDSLRNFQLLLERPEIDIKSTNVAYMSINNGLLKNMDEKNIELRKKNIDLTGFKDKGYAHYSKLNYYRLNEVKAAVKEPYSEKCKQMQFALIDYFSQKGLLKE